MPKITGELYGTKNHQKLWKGNALGTTGGQAEGVLASKAAFNASSIHHWATDDENPDYTARVARLSKCTREFELQG